MFYFSGIMLFWNGKNPVMGLSKKILVHKCHFCQYTTRYSTHLKRHILIHTGERPFACELCNYKCNQKESLKKHMLTHL